MINNMNSALLSDGYKLGHVHGGLSNKGIIQHSPTQMDVGVDCNNYKPFSYEKVKEIITKQCLAKR